LRAKGESSIEIIAAAQVLLQHSVPISFSEPNIVDIVGTGGDGRSTFNISTAAAFVAAAAGVKVVKHCGRSSSGNSGSSDVLEALGAIVDLSAEQSLKVFEECGMVFLYAPRFNPVMEKVARVRREIGVPTLFNILGPLINPARPKRQVVGVFTSTLLSGVAIALRDLGSTNALVVHGYQGVDELSITHPTCGMYLNAGEISSWDTYPYPYGCRYSSENEVVVDNPQQSAAVIETVLQGKSGYALDVVLLNAAAAIQVAGLAPDLPTALTKAEMAIDSGAGLALKNKYIQTTQSV
jgi:anthranilate phosphoribosyltransferase